MARKSAREKLQAFHPSHGKPFVIPPHMRKRSKARTMVVPRPLDVEALMRTPRKGRLITVGEIRARLARAARVEAACPLTTGIFMRIAADAAEEDAAAGLKPVTPYWRTIRDDGSLIEKFPGGIENQIRRLEAEGHTVERPKRGKPRLVGFEKNLTAEKPRARGTKSLGM